MSAALRGSAMLVQNRAKPLAASGFALETRSVLLCQPQPARETGEDSLEERPVLQQ
ncbi:MAG TPA: hypothetical protein VFV38_06240 [Ktedonobacteraceae bacterium]|nr:hypothetical protein [Ktedonobacteraceae bacterium]